MACQNQSIGPFSLTQTITTFLNGSIFIVYLLLTYSPSYLPSFSVTYSCVLTHLSPHVPCFSVIPLFSATFLVTYLSSHLSFSSVTVFSVAFLQSYLPPQLPPFSATLLVIYLSSHLSSFSVTVLSVAFLHTYLPPQLPSSSLTSLSSLFFLLSYRLSPICISIFMYIHIEGESE